MTTTDGYITNAESYYRKPHMTGLNVPLNFITINLVKEEGTKKSKQALKTYISNGNSPREQYGPGGI